MKTADPELTQYVSEKRELIFLDDICKVKNDPDRDARKSLPAFKGY
jgi:hypothetical protein